MKVITISGKAQNGKDTTAGLLKAALEADGYKVLITQTCLNIFANSSLDGTDRKMMLVGIFFNMSGRTSFGRSALTIGLGLSHRFWSYSQMSGTMC